MSLTLKILFLVMTLLSALLGVLGYFRQNKPGRLGGPICKAKAFWLYYTIYTWFFVLPYGLYLNPEIGSAHRTVWLTFTISMWIRGLVEVYMLFVTKNWTPIIGISHDIITFLCMVIAPFWFKGDWSGSPVICFFTASMYLSIVVETYYAYSFFQLMKGRTQGEQGMWYAHKDDPRFKRIILVTTIFNYILFLALILFLMNYIF